MEEDFKQTHRGEADVKMEAEIRADADPSQSTEFGKWGLQSGFQVPLPS